MSNMTYNKHIRYIKFNLNIYIFIKNIFKVHRIDEDVRLCRTMHKQYARQAIISLKKYIMDLANLDSHR